MLRALLLLFLAVPAAAQSPAASPATSPSAPSASATSATATARWSGLATRRTETFRTDRPAWHETRAVAQRVGPAGAVGVEAARIERNGRADAALALDLYRVLSPRVYANVRAQAAPRAAVVPHLDALAEVYAALGRGWDGSAGVRLLVVPGADVPLASAALNRTLATPAGAVAVGVRATAALQPVPTLSTALLVRYLPDAPARGVATRAALTVGTGQEAVVADGAAGRVVVRRQLVAAVSGQRRVAGPFGVLGGVSYTADGTLTRWSAEAGLAVRL